MNISVCHAIDVVIDGDTYGRILPQNVKQEIRNKQIYNKWKKFADKLRICA